MAGKRQRRAVLQSCAHLVCTDKQAGRHPQSTRGRTGEATRRGASRGESAAQDAGANSSQVGKKRK